MPRLANKIALITGAGSGFGLAMTKRFAQEGAKVFAVDVSANIFEAVKTLDGDITPFVGDVSSQEQVDVMFDDCIKKYGRLDILCNNAGIGGKNAPIHEYKMEDWDVVFNINVRGYFMVMQRGILEMLKIGGGSIVNTASIGGFRASPNSAAYIASKGANVMMTKQASAEYVKQGIRVNAVAPGIFNTAILKGASAEQRAYLDAQVPMGRLGEPDEMANLALFLASDEASYITGQVYIIDGGRAVL
ncbi:SDR family oxidoreductase [Paenibacillus sp. LS1]|uniref:SDR family NAD(P)-dependent oxidoreductase n=1 Tax=Paenibacillus sp. LS1 TaxID=2992120 RepID=UPI00222FF5C9|nr:SDR family oxidoreductase [Paenibacillus sp. LS1]MCW3794445.1 SDR family oxidoreductase [Paenibacillus sp. LS1]